MPKLESRIAAYTRLLGLDDQQQAQLRALLLRERVEMRRLWNDSALSSAERVLRTRVIGDAIADRIRAMLNEEQLKKYNAPRTSPNEGARVAGDPISIESWMGAAQSSEPSQSATYRQ